MKLLGFADLSQSDLGGELRQTFHRLQVRGRLALRRVDLEGALVGGIDEASGIAGTGVRKLSLGARGSLVARLPHLRLHLGADLELSRFTAEHFVNPDAPSPGTVPDEYGDLIGDRDGVVAGAFAAGTLDLFSNKLSATAGVRADVYHAGAVTLLGVDPRFSLTVSPLRFLKLRASVGLYQQPPSFPVALPGIDTFALSLGLQRAWQGAFTVSAELPESLSFSATGFYQRFFNITDAVADLSSQVTCQGPAPGELSGLAAAILRENAGAAYGMELFLRRKRGRVTGWIAYTLSRSERQYVCGLRPADFDQTHVLNVVLQARLPWKLLLGVRWFFASGRPATLLSPVDPENTPRNNIRLPPYFQVDIRLDREWLFKRWALAVSLEILNLAYTPATYGLYYDKPDPLPHLGDPHLFEFRWILPSIGLRGRY
jgi:hypothetical protein